MSTQIASQGLACLLTKKTLHYQSGKEMVRSGVMAHAVLRSSAWQDSVGCTPCQSPLTSALQLVSCHLTQTHGWWLKDSECCVIKYRSFLEKGMSLKGIQGSWRGGQAQTMSTTGHIEFLVPLTCDKIKNIWSTLRVFFEIKFLLKVLRVLLVSLNIIVQCLGREIFLKCVKKSNRGTSPTSRDA